MSWSRFEDGYDEDERVEDAWELDPRTIGLHVMATTCCARRETDGVIPPRWLRLKLPIGLDREKLLAVMVKVGLFDRLPAGETRQLAARRGPSVVVGPFAEDRYIVADYLERNDSAEYLRDRRARDAARKAPGIRAESKPIPPGLRAESERSPNGLARAAPRGGAQVGSGLTTLPRPERKDPPNPPPAGGRQRDIAAWESHALAWAKSLGVTGANVRPVARRSEILRAVRQSQCWASKDPAGTLRAVVGELYPALLETAGPA